MDAPVRDHYTIGVVLNSGPGAYRRVQPPTIAGLWVRKIPKTGPLGDRI